MANLNKEFFKFDEKIKLTPSRSKKLQGSIDEIERKILNYFRDYKVNEIKPIFRIQGSFVMGTTINPIVKYDLDNNQILHYDLDDGVYFIGNEAEAPRSIDTLHSWIFNATDEHTYTPNKSKTTCVRVLFADGHHIDLPIYYQYGDTIKLAHKTKGWIKSNPVEFADWFNRKATTQLKRIVRYLKAWKNYKETKNTNLKFPSGFALTILATNSYYQTDNDDEAFLRTILKIYQTLEDNFECRRPTTPKGEDIFEEFSETRKNDFMRALKSLVKDAEKAYNEPNYKFASKLLQKHFGDRFPTGRDQESKDKLKKISSVLGAASIKPKPYANFFETLLILIAVIGFFKLIDK